MNRETPAPGVDSCRAAKRVREYRFESPDIGIGIEGPVVGPVRGGPGAADPTSLRRGLGLSHREPLQHDALGEPCLPARIFHRHERPRMARRELAPDDEVLDPNR